MSNTIIQVWRVRRIKKNTFLLAEINGRSYWPHLGTAVAQWLR